VCCGGIDSKYVFGSKVVKLNSLPQCGRQIGVYNVGASEYSLNFGR